MVLFTTKAEYMAATQACKKAIWVKKLLDELGHKQEKITLFCNYLDMLKIHTKKNLADVMAKPINTDKFVWSRSPYGLIET